MTIVFVLRLSCYFVKILSSWYEFYGLVKNTNDLKSIYITIFTEYKNQNMTFQLLHIHHSNYIPSTSEIYSSLYHFLDAWKSFG